MRQSEITKLSVEDLQEQLSTNRKKYTDLKMAHTISPLENPIQLRKLRRTIARMATELTKREAE